MAARQVALACALVVIAATGLLVGSWLLEEARRSPEEPPEAVEMGVKSGVVLDLLPEDFPTTVPLPAGATVLSGRPIHEDGVRGWDVQLETPVELKELAEMYVVELSAAGWEITEDEVFGASRRHAVVAGYGYTASIELLGYPDTTVVGLIVVRGEHLPSAGR